jgi:hypothetical protein
MHFIRNVTVPLSPHRCTVRSTLLILSFRAHISSSTIRSVNYFGKVLSFYATKIIRLLNVQTLSQLLCTLSRPGQDFYSRLNIARKYCRGRFQVSACHTRSVFHIFSVDGGRKEVRARNCCRT